MDEKNSHNIYLGTEQLVTSAHEETNSTYTLDIFRCCLCNCELTCIDDYVTHMTLEEHCVMVLCSSRNIKDLLLPRFIKKTTEQKLNEETKTEGFDVLKKRLAYDEEILEILNNSNLSQAIEVETGGKTRWKCKICCLTFSRQAAFINHHRLQHSPPNDIKVIGEKVNSPTTKVKLKKEIVPKSEIPIKPAIPFESKPCIDNLNIIKDSQDWDDTSCDQCGQIFKSIRNLKTHVAVVHSTIQPFVCEYSNCGQAFKTKGSYIRHQRRHTGERPYKCFECGRVFRESGALVRHKKSREFCRNKSDLQLPRYGTTQPIGKQSLDQKPQPSQFHEESLMDNEFKNKKLAGSPPEESKAAIRAQILKARQNFPINIKEEKITMGASNKPIKDKPSPRRIGIRCKTEPLSSDSITSEVNEKNVKFEAVDELSNAIDSKPDYLPNVLRKSFICPVCCQSYLKKAHLDQHLRKHMAEFNMRCNQCEKSFTTDQALIRHLISHSSVRQYECCLCDKKFKLPSHAKIHLLSHSSEKSHSCPDCGRYFKTVSSRNAHMKIHSGIKSYSCIQCDKAFVTKASLDRHYRTHSGEAPFHCTYCGQRFKEKGTLKRHLNHKMPCSKQAKYGSDQIGIQFPEEKFHDRLMKDFNPFFENDPTFEDTESDILNSRVSPSLSSLLEEVHSPLFSPSLSISSRQSTIDEENEDSVGETNIDSSLLSTAIALSQDNNILTSTETSDVLPGSSYTFLVSEEPKILCNSNTDKVKDGIPYYMLGQAEYCQFNNA